MCTTLHKNNINKHICINFRSRQVKIFLCIPNNSLKRVLSFDGNHKPKKIVHLRDLQKHVLGFIHNGFPRYEIQNYALFKQTQPAKIYNLI